MEGGSFARAFAVGRSVGRFEPAGRVAASSCRVQDGYYPPAQVTAFRFLWGHLRGFSLWWPTPANAEPGRRWSEVVNITKLWDVQALPRNGGNVAEYSQMHRHYVF